MMHLTRDTTRRALAVVAAGCFVVFGLASTVALALEWGLGVSLLGVNAAAALVCVVLLLMRW